MNHSCRRRRVGIRNTERKTDPKVSVLCGVIYGKFNSVQNQSVALEARTVAALGGNGDWKEDARSTDYTDVCNLRRVTELYAYCLCSFLYGCANLNQKNQS